MDDAAHNCGGSSHLNPAWKFPHKPARISGDPRSYRLSSQYSHLIFYHPTLCELDILDNEETEIPGAQATKWSDL